ncbi:DegT/DnrJ/EryC1/StrS family aminotransferase [Ruania zhangjianzhongii]|uniref:DegT/DnrJ/EryC1/StrS family aminotransferase n=1 Tax=Ruania zhangjianzhongii TaxID=2603206 RepID=UPI0011CCAF00|nr:DegT/DnrJ/EryC1/StrS aminotransferase family protein [Ruania zhangjianzhongii]
MSRILLSTPDITETEEEYILDAIRSGWVAPLGPHVDAFEREVAERIGVRHALALSSGTAALHLALIHLGARPGTVVVLPSMTFAASANAVVYTGAEPVFVDSLAEDGNVDPGPLLDAVDTLQAEGREVVAAMTVDLFGRTCDYSTIEPALAERGVSLLEDAAEAFGAIYQGRAAGSFGHAAVLSFNGNKIMTTSGGGMLVSNDRDLIAHARKLSTQAREPVPWYEHEEVGYNYRLSNLLAALGRGQLSRLDAMIARRRAIRRTYVHELSQLPAQFLGSDGADERDNCWLTTLTVDDRSTDVTELIRSLSEDGIEARHLWKPMHLQPVFASKRFFGSDIAAGLFTRGIALPSGSTLTDDDLTRVLHSIRANLAAKA